ncbi:PREDICTED: zinc finger protein 335 [Nanorana parkeri]|uniref:zinc finger protein 335 n=1 Tax=Nanorana parkeri TaxID=125878 RepID=UPI000854EADC|nr:PREDICTED: zinc finger protein 335 [Nanorana parkeri]
MQLVTLIPRPTIHLIPYMAAAQGLCLGMEEGINLKIVDISGTDRVQEDITVSISAGGTFRALMHSTSQETSMATDTQTVESSTNKIKKHELKIIGNDLVAEDPYGKGNVEVQKPSIIPSQDSMDIEESSVIKNTNNSGDGDLSETLDRPQNLIIIQRLEDEANNEVSVSLMSSTKNTEQLDIEQSPISKALQEVTQCLIIDNQHLERNTDKPITNHTQNNQTDSKERDPETCFYKQANQEIVPVMASNNNSIPGTRIQEGAVSNVQMLSCQSNSCSVPGVCSICQSVLTQSPQTIILPPDVSGTSYPVNFVDRIIHGSNNPQLIQGCIVASSEGRNSQITQYVILEEPENVQTRYPVTISPTDANKAYTPQSADGPVAATDLDALEGMMEVVVVHQYKCKMCPYKSALKSTLLRHVKERHVPTACEDKRVSRKAVRLREEEEDEDEDDIVDAGAIDDPNNDSDYSPGKDVTHSRHFEGGDGALVKERPCRRRGRPRKIPRIQGPEQDSGPPILVVESEPEILVVLSDTENKEVSIIPPKEEPKIPARRRGRPPKHLMGKNYRRYKGQRRYKSPSKPLLRPFMCRICGSHFLTREDYSFHVNSHDGNDPQTFQCQQCNYQCRRWSSLKEHMFNHQGKKPYKCDQCDYTSVYKKDVTRHSVVHKRDRARKEEEITKKCTYPCPICNRVYNLQKRLTQHLKSHSNDKPHMCDKCGKAFKKRYTFKMHLLTHLECVEENRYKCEFCEYVSEDRKQLLNHQLTHMNDTPFNCNQCQYRTLSQDALLSHQAIKHAAGKPFACEYCHFTTKHMKNLSLHVRSRHTYLFQEWSQRHTEETRCRRRPYFSHQQIEQLKLQQQDQAEAQNPSEPYAELTYHLLHPQSQEETQVEDTLEGATIIYEQDGEGDELATQAALDLLLNMSAQRDVSGGPLKVAVVKSMDNQQSEVTSQEPHMAQVLTLHMDDRQVTDMQEATYEESAVSEAGYEGEVQQITINTAFTTAEYSLVNAESMQAPLCRTSQIHLSDSGKDGNTLQILNKAPQVTESQDQALPLGKKYSCKICKCTFWGRAEMEIHKKAHIEGRDGFKCPDCNYTADDWTEVRDHMSVHFNLRPHRCNQCSFASKNKKDLSRHLMTHANLRPHLCTLCGQRFSRKGHLKFHIERLHTEVSLEQPEQSEHSSLPALDEEHIYLTQEETMSTQDDTAYIQEITTADGQTLQQLVTSDSQVQYIISQEDVPHLIPQEYVVLQEGHHIQVQDGQITHIQYEPGGPFLQDPQIHFVPMSSSQQLLTQEQLEAAARSAVTAVADAAMAQTVYTADTDSALQQEIQYDVITLGE